MYTYDKVKSAKDSKLETEATSVRSMLKYDNNTN